MTLQELLEQISQQRSKAESLKKGAEQGVAMGFADELAGLIGNSLESIPGSSRSQDEELRAQGFQLPDSASYESIRNDARQEYKQAEDANPKMYMAGNILGGAATLPLGAAKGTGLAVQGARAGTIGGLGSSDSDNLAGMIEDSGKGLVVGAAMGKAAEAIPGIANKLGHKLENKLDKLRDVDFDTTPIGQIVEKNIRQPLKTQLNKVEHTRHGVENAKKLQERAHADFIDNQKLDEYLNSPDYIQREKEAMLNREYEKMPDIIDPNESTQVIEQIAKRRKGE